MSTSPTPLSYKNQLYKGLVVFDALVYPPDPVGTVIVSICSYEIMSDPYYLPTSYGGTWAVDFVRLKMNGTIGEYRISSKTKKWVDGSLRPGHKGQLYLTDHGIGCTPYNNHRLFTMLDDALEYGESFVGLRPTISSSQNQEMQADTTDDLTTRYLRAMKVLDYF